MLHICSSNYRLKYIFFSGPHFLFFFNVSFESITSKQQQTHFLFSYFFYSLHFFHSFFLYIHTYNLHPLATFNPFFLFSVLDINLEIVSESIPVTIRHKTKEVQYLFNF